MNELSSLGLILLLALGAGHLVKYVRLPEVTGYNLDGIVLGPSMLGWVSVQNLAALEELREDALGLILFSVGTVFEASRFRRVGRQVLSLTLYESALAALLVTAGMLWLGVSWQASFLLGAIAGPGLLTFAAHSQAAFSTGNVDVTEQAVYVGQSFLLILPLDG